MKKILTKIKKAYQKGFFYTFWRIKFSLFRFFKCEKVKIRYGIKCFSDFNDKTFRFYFLGIYGFFFSDYLKFYPSKFIFIDIGANKGLYTIIAAKNTNCQKVISFEPISTTYNFLKKNCKLNNISHKVDSYNLAISSFNEKKEITYDESHSGASSLEIKYKNTKSSVVKIQTVNKSFFDNFNVNENIDYVLKVDVEGFELIVLKEIFKSKFKKLITSIFYEVEENWTDPNSIKKLLFDNGFKKFKRYGDGKHYDIMASK